METARLLRFAAVILLLLLLQAVFASGAVNPYYVRVLILCCFAIMLAVSLNIIIGYAGQFSIGHAGFYAVGAYRLRRPAAPVGARSGQAAGVG